MKGTNLQTKMEKREERKEKEQKKQGSYIE